MKWNCLTLACAASLLTAACDSKDNRPGDPKENTNTPDENWNNPPATTNPPSPATAPQAKAPSLPPSASMGGTEVLELEDARQDYLSTLTERLREMDAKVAALSRKAEDSSAEVKQQADQALTDLRRQQRHVATQLEQLRAANDASWNGVKSGFEAALQELEKSYTNAMTKLSGAAR